MPVSVDESQSERWKSIRRFTDRASAFAHPQFEPGPENINAVHQCPVLVVGAGGLGCEILKDLALSGFKNIEVIDMDTIDLSNLNRQFLFRETDIGKSKAEVAAAFIEKRVNGCSVKAHNCKIQDKDISFYRKFSIVICGLDSVPARRWLNAIVCNLVSFDEDGEIDPSTIIPLIDGGTEGFVGHARVILPYMTPCVECALDLYPPQVNYPMCTIAHTPRLPEHCVEYVKLVLWDKEDPFSGEKLDGDNPTHVNWVYKKALERAEQFKIQGVDLRLTQGVLKRIIPNVASTNAVIAGCCVLEALKLASNISCTINNYLNFNDIVTLERNEGCIVCSRAAVTVDVDPQELFETFVEQLKKRYNLSNPSVRSSDETLYMINTLMPQMVEISRTNLKKTLPELAINENAELAVADDSLHQAITFRIKYKSAES